MRLAGRSGWRRLTLPATLMSALLASACVTMPTAGPVSEATGTVDPNRGEPPVFQPEPPRPDDTKESLITHFLDAMEAFPLSTRVARMYLAEESRPWDPSARTITYVSKTTPVASGNTVTVEVDEANWLDERGRWRGPLPASERTLRFTLVREREHWRIAEAPNALVVGESWLNLKFRRLNLYFYDPSSQVLVPEPVFVPVGSQLPTGLVVSLLRGPGADLRQVSRTYLPATNVSGLSVPVSSDGVAEISIDGDGASVSAEEGNRMLAQLAWTLRQADGVESFRLTIGGVPIAVDGQHPVTSVDYGAGVSPTSSPSADPLYAVRDGRLVNGSIDELSFADGPLGQEESPYTLRSVASIDTDGQVAAVTKGGGTVLSASVYRSPPAAASGNGIRVLATGTNFAEPSWDFDGNVWLLDRTRDGAAIAVTSNERRPRLPEPVQVPGVTGRRIPQMLVSRDGSRLVALRRTRSGDELVVSRIRRDSQGRATGASRAKPLSVAAATADGLQIRDLTWRSATTVAVLYREQGSSPQVRVVSLDGSPFGSVGQTRWSPGETARYLVGSPVPGEPMYVVENGRAVALTESGDRQDLPDGTLSGSLTYGS